MRAFARGRRSPGRAGHRRSSLISTSAICRRTVSRACATAVNFHPSAAALSRSGRCLAGLFDDATATARRHGSMRASIRPDRVVSDFRSEADDGAIRRLARARSPSLELSDRHLVDHRAPGASAAIRHELCDAPVQIEAHVHQWLVLDPADRSRSCRTGPGGAPSALSGRRSSTFDVRFADPAGCDMSGESDRASSSMACRDGIPWFQPEMTGGELARVCRRCSTAISSTTGR